MKITEIRSHPMSVQVPGGWTAHESMGTSQLILVEVRTDDGIVGYGEIAGGPQKQVCDFVATFADVVKGMNPLGHLEVWSKLMSTTVPRPGGLGGWDGLPAPMPRNARPQIMSAIAGIDIALWDIKAKAAKMPLFRLLGGSRTSVFTYSTGGYYDVDDPHASVAAEFVRYVEMGYKAVKMKCGALSLEAEANRIAEVRAAIGPDILIMLDMNAPYDVEGCIRFAHAVAPSDIFWLEEPLFWYLQPADYVKLADASPIPLAHGEREWHRFTIRDFIDSGALRYVQFDSTRYAGFTESLRIAQYAEMKRVMIAPHSQPHIHAHLVSAFGDAAFAAESHGNHDRHPIQHHVYQGGPFVKDGMEHLTETPGFGFEIDWKAVDKYRA